MKPSIGRIVHFQTYGSAGGEYLPAPMAALVTRVDDSFGTDEHPETRVDLAVFYESGLAFRRNIEFAESPTPGHWNWPPRVEG